MDDVLARIPNLVRLLWLGLICTAVAAAPVETGSPDELRYDLVLRGGRIVDGTGSPWFVADVGIRAGRIAKIGPIDPAAADETIDATGLFVAPGFVDMMGQTATPMLDDPKSALNLLSQGITTINAGEGGSAAPLSAADGATRGWTTVAEYFQLLDSRGLPLNVVQTIGHTQVRRLVLGDGNRQPGPRELEQMRGLVREAMEAGAIGVSTALIYPPAVYAETAEIASLAEVAGQYGGHYYTHMRNEGDRLIEAIDEALEIGRRGNTPVHIFHLKAAGQQNWSKMALAIAKIRSARAAGQQVTADVYPYVHNGLGIAAFIHPRHFEKGRADLVSRLADESLRRTIREEMEQGKGWENWFRHVDGDWNRVVIGQANDERYAGLTGQSVAQIADKLGEDPWEVFFGLVRSGAFALPQSMTEANKILAMRQNFVSFCTDVGPAGGSRIASHPRAFGSFPRLLSRYVRELGALSLERAVAQASAGASNCVLAYDRGRIAEGLAADIIVFDFGKLTDKATFARPAEPSEGMRYVFVNGVLVLKDGRLLRRRPGRVLRGPGYVVEAASHRVSTGKCHPSLSSFDRRIREFVREHRVPGAAVAVTDQGRLVFARGYGYADVGAREKATPESLFRIASISKPITAVAVLKLVEEKRLKLDDRVFELLDEELRGGDGSDPRLGDITIRHLLEHRGGWDRGESFDAMFQSTRFAKALGVPSPAGSRDVIRAMRTQKLDFDPGQRYAYSNYGYCLLGRVIEKLTGQPYERFVRETVLAPLGIRSMRVGRTRLEGRHPGEVRYYDPRRAPSVFESNLGELVPSSYGGWYLQAMDSHGGWIASAVDLARFACAFDFPQKCEVLSAPSIELMHRRPPGRAGHDENGDPTSFFYSLGWMNRVVGAGRVNHWHTGSLPGTATIIIRRHDGRNFIALLNARVSPRAGHLGRAIDPVLHQAAAEVTDWPEIDLFDEF